MARPRRLYRDKKKDKFYYLVDGKKIFIKVPEGMSQAQVQKINIKNIIQGEAKKLKPRKKRVKATYDKKISKDMQKGQPFLSGKPTYFFQPPSSQTSSFTTIQKGDDSTAKLVELLLKNARENTNLSQPKLAIPIPEALPIPKAMPIPVADIAPLIPPVPSDIITTPSVIDSTYIPPKKSETTWFTQSIPKQPSISSLPSLEPDIPPSSESEEEVIPVSTSPDIDDSIFLDFALEQAEAGNIEFRRRISDYKQKDYKKLGEILGINANKRTLVDNRKLIVDELKRRAGLGISGKGKKQKDDGLYNDEIEEIMKKRIKNFVPVVAQDKVHHLLHYVNPENKYFSAVINTEPSDSSGRHWRCIFIDARDDYTSAEYFDPLAESSKPEDTLLEVMRKISKMLNPEKYFKFKFNKLQRQSEKSSNCGYHVMQFIEDRVNGENFEEASGWNSYKERQKQKGKGIDDSVNGEKEIKPYQEMIEKKFKYYL